MLGKLGKSIYGLCFDVPKEEKVEATEKTEQTPAPKQQPVEIGTITPGNSEIGSTGKADTAIAESLAAALESSNLDGYDYFEFAKTLDVLSVTIPSEQVKFQSAFATASVMGISKDKLIETANHYLNVLQTEAQKFGKFVEMQVEENVTSKEGSLTEKDNLIKEKAAQIQQLTEDINVLTQEKTEIENMVAENKIKIEKIQNNFVATIKVFVEKIKKDIEKISTYIP